MRRADLEHVVAAAANIVGQDDFVVIGSQAVLGTFPDAPEDLLRSQEADIYPLHAPHRAIEIDGALGDGSQFQRAYGYYAHGVGVETATPPDGWQERLVRVDIVARPASRQSPVAWCLEAHDLVLSKCAAGRDRDWEFARDALAAGIVDYSTLTVRAEDLPIDDERKDHVRKMLRRLGPD